MFEQEGPTPAPAPEVATPESSTPGAPASTEREEEEAAAPDPAATPAPDPAPDPAGGEGPAVGAERHPLDRGLVPVQGQRRGVGRGQQPIAEARAVRLERGDEVADGGEQLGAEPHQQRGDLGVERGRRLAQLAHRAGDEHQPPPRPERAGQLDHRAERRRIGVVRVVEDPRTVRQRDCFETHRRRREGLEALDDRPQFEPERAADRDREKRVS